MPRELADILIDSGKLDAQALDRALALGRSTGERTDVVLTRLGLVSEDDMAQALAEFLGLRVARAEHYPDVPVLTGRVTPRFLREARVLPLEERETGLTLAMADPLDRYALDAMGLLIGKKIERWVAVPAELERALARLYGEGGATAEKPVADARDLYSADAARLRDRASDAPAIRAVDQMIEDATAERASDIHLEPLVDRIRVRFRIDGMLRERPAPMAAVRTAIVNRIKVMAGLNTAERRLAQDGRIRTSVRGRELDIRVSIIPVQYGESVVLRLLDKSHGPVDFDRLGFAPDLAAKLGDLLALSHGLVLVTGPVGSGKTTTLYAGLKRLNSSERKIVTAEDPIEYELPGINQTQVKPAIGFTFADVLRATLRHDPDVLMIGEIRDRETAEISVQAALTGHLVLTTLHTNDAASAVTRLLDMGIESFLLASVLRAVVAQRLVRTLCLACRAPYRPSAEEAAYAGIAPTADGQMPDFFHAVGCPACGGTGYSGRTVVAELLPVDEVVRPLILQRADWHTIARAVGAAGVRSLAADGFAKVRAGVTTIAEIVRVTRTV
ncbi:MAG: type II/IV secretion system protein [Alphaproteobacteria bacterium]|nr:type II/IV secretion system protein [Alphaproteobacteria bacterium]